MDVSHRLPWRRSLGAAAWIGSLILGVALITGALGGAGVRAAHTSSVHSPAAAVRTVRGAVPAVHGRLLQQRIGGTPMSSQ